MERDEGEQHQSVAYSMHMIRIEILRDGYDFISLCIEKIVYPLAVPSAAYPKGKTFVIFSAKTVLLENIYFGSTHLYFFFFLSLRHSRSPIILVSLLFLFGCAIFDYNRLSFDAFFFLSLILPLKIALVFPSRG